MNDRSEGIGRYRLVALLAVLVLILGAVAAGCGGEDEAAAPTEPPVADTGAAPAEPTPPAEPPAEPPTDTTEAAPIKIGHLSNCEGPFAPFYELTVGGSMLPLIQRGGVATAKPSDGVTGVAIGGHPIEVVFGCSDATPDKALEEARRLSEQENVDILIGPLSGSEGIAVANYSKEQPGKTYVNGTSAAQDTTLKVRSPNFFRWNTDGAQWMAGEGDYAYNTLGWRKVVTVADDYDFPYTQTAGFVAEFCALGGEVVRRIWPPLGEEDYSSYIAQIPESGIDGFYLSVGGTGTLAFVKQYSQLKGNLADKVIGGSIAIDPLVLGEIGARMIGVVAGGPVAADSQDPAFLEYLEAFRAAYPDIAGIDSLFAVNNYNAMEAILQSLEAVNGDLSDGHAAFRETMTSLVLAAPNGTITLDENRQAIGDNFLFQVVEDETGDGVPDLKTLKKIEKVDATFGGNFSPDTPTPDRENPKCVAGNAPPWTGGG